MYCFLKFFGVFDGLRVLYLEIFRRLRRATYITPWNFPAPAASCMYYSLKFFGVYNGLRALHLEIFLRLRRATCITLWNFSAPAAGYLCFLLTFLAPVAGYGYFSLKIFGACGGLLLFILRFFRPQRLLYYMIHITYQDFQCLRRATILHLQIHGTRGELCLTPQIFRRQTYRSLIPSLQIYHKVKSLLTATTWNYYEKIFFLCKDIFDRSTSKSGEARARQNPVLVEVMGGVFSYSDLRILVSTFKTVKMTSRTKSE